MNEYTVTYLIDVLWYELNIRGYRKIKIKRKNNKLKIKVVDLNDNESKAYVYNLDMINPFSTEIEDIVMYVLKQIALYGINRGDKM